jgi:hypothetical protein
MSKWAAHTGRESYNMNLSNEEKSESKFLVQQWNVPCWQPMELHGSGMGFGGDLGLRL